MLFIPSSSFSWGFYAHKKINRMAVFSLPKPLFAFYKLNIDKITSLAVQADKRRYAVKGEARGHYIDLDHYGINPFDSIPQFWNDAVDKFSEDSLYAHGIVPWKISFVFHQLKKAFISADVINIIKYSSDLGHYVADAHVPLHCTSNYNGQKTDQYGIHGLWESRLPELFGSKYDFVVGTARIVDDVNKLAWSVVTASYMAVDSVLNFEKIITGKVDTDMKIIYEQRGQVTMRTYSPEFSKQYHVILNGMVERRLRSAIRVIADLWYTAWVDAGQPDLSITYSMPIELHNDSSDIKSPLLKVGELPGHTE